MSLEKRLGVRLLNRSSRALGLTEPGRVYFERSKTIVDDGNCGAGTGLVKYHSTPYPPNHLPQLVRDPRASTRRGLRRTFLLPTCAASKSFWARSIVGRFVLAHSAMAPRGARRVRPRGVSSYSTRGGMVGYTVRVTSPSRSSPLRVRVSMRCEMPLIVRRSSLKRIGPFRSNSTTSTVHLSPIRASVSLIARQSP